MIVPVLTSLDAVTAGDALGRIEENASCFAVAQPRGGNQTAVLSSEAFSRGFQCVGHAPMYHFFFAAVNYGRAYEDARAEEITAIEKREARKYVRFDLPEHGTLRQAESDGVG